LELSLDAGSVTTGKWASRTFAPLRPKIEAKSVSALDAFQHDRFHKTRPISIFGYVHPMAVTLPLHKMSLPVKPRI
jgi:hypothetical protein